MFDEAFDIGQQVIQNSNKKGIKEIEIYFSYNNDKELTINGKSISTQRAKEELGAGIRVIENGSQGFSFTNIISKQELQKCVNEAFQIAKKATKIDGIGFAPKQKYQEIHGIYNKELTDLTIDEITEDGLAFIDGYTGIDERISTVLSSIGVNTSGVGILNSNGVNAVRKNASYQAGLLTVASEKEKSGAFIFDTIFSRNHDVDLKAIGEKLGKKAIDNLNQVSIKQFDGEVILQSDAMLNPIGIVIALAVSADWRQRGISFWKDKLADKVADERLNFYDKPFDISGGAGVRQFDDEGNVTNEIAIIKDGVLQTFLHNQRTANKENLKSTGNAQRGGGGGPAFQQLPNGIFPNNSWIAPGDMSEEEMIAETKKGIIVHSFTGTVRQQNGIFSGVAKGAYLIENGEIVSPVTGVSISGNVFEIINQITGIGKELKLTGNLLNTPIMKFEGIKISTK
ncbi:MAG: TldD/PmbA family protein [Candidatus Thorarchaeota archaeon]